MLLNALVTLGPIRVLLDLLLDLMQRQRQERSCKLETDGNLITHLCSHGGKHVLWMVRVHYFQSDNARLATITAEVADLHLHAITGKFRTLPLTAGLPCTMKLTAKSECEDSAVIVFTI